MDRRPRFHTPLRVLYDHFSRKSPTDTFVEGLLVVLTLGVTDWLLFWAWGLTLSVFFGFVIIHTAHFGGRRVGFVLSAISVLVWTLGEMQTVAGVLPSGWWVTGWNIVTRLAGFALITVMAAHLREHMVMVQQLATTDPLTGAANRRYFCERTTRETMRLRRYGCPFTVVYIDLDSFKEINDSKGHSAGDEVLSTVARVLLENVRATDCVARLGGDEFAILLPETRFEAAADYLKKARRQLSDSMRASGWEKVTFSIGAVTFEVSPGTVDEVVKQADHLMYTVKRNGKNDVRHERFAGTCR